MCKKTISLVLLAMFFLPSVSLARHTSNYSRVDTSDLDDDQVEEIPIPVLFGVNYDNLTPDFGDPRGGGTRTHEGQDMLAPQGTPIVSPTEAVVIRTGKGDSAGNYVYTANPGGEVFRYMHLDDIADIDRGDELDVGDFIGTVGDTGNAPDGVYHLHLEIRDEDNQATDPYPRMTDEFTLKEKMSFMRNILQNYSRSARDDYAEFLVETFPSEFREALNKKYNLPDEIEEALEDAGVHSTADLQEQLNSLIATIPTLLTKELRNGDSGASVTLLQFFLIYASSGQAHDQLVLAGPTGYFGSITEAALLEYQADNELELVGVYDSSTRTEMMEYGK